MTIKEAMRRLRRGGDATLATQLHDLLRFQKGLNYSKIVELYAESNEIDEHTALSEWDEHMLGAERMASW